MDTQDARCSSTLGAFRCKYLTGHSGQHFSLEVGFWNDNDADPRMTDEELRRSLWNENDARLAEEV